MAFGGAKANGLWRSDGKWHIEERRCIFVSALVWVTMCMRPINPSEIMIDHKPSVDGRVHGNRLEDGLVRHEPPLKSSDPPTRVAVAQ